jgi:hypothetical protein
MKCFQIALVAAFLVSPPGPIGHLHAEDDAFRAIFNGVNLDGWAGDEAFWRVENGVVIGETTAENPAVANTFLIWTEGQPDDFELKFRYRIVSEQANSGVQVRSERLENLGMRGYQADIATVDWITGILYEERGRGILARRGERATIVADGVRRADRFAEETDLLGYVHTADWNEYHVTCSGDTIVSRINGREMHRLTDRAPEARREGSIGFQVHTGPPMTIQFKDIRLKLSRE